MNENVVSGVGTIAPNSITRIWVADPHRQMKLALGVESANVIHAFGHLAISFLSFRAWAATHCGDRVALVERVGIIVLCLDPKFKISLLFVRYEEYSPWRIGQSSSAER